MEYVCKDLSQIGAEMSGNLVRLIDSPGSSLISYQPTSSILLAIFRMNPQLPESFNHRTEKLATGRVYHFVRFI